MRKLKLDEPAVEQSDPLVMSDDAFRIELDKRVQYSIDMAKLTATEIKRLKGKINDIRMARDADYNLAIATNVLAVQLGSKDRTRAIDTLFNDAEADEDFVFPGEEGDDDEEEPEIDEMFEDQDGNSWINPYSEEAIQKKLNAKLDAMEADMLQKKDQKYYNKKMRSSLNDW